MKQEVLNQVQLELIQALAKATLDGKINWLRTDPKEVAWKQDTIEQFYTMLSDEGIFATFTRLRDNSMELLVQVQETGFYREYELTKADGASIVEALSELYRALPSVFRMIQDFQMIVDRLQN
ncbi:MAG: hypothetical protein JNN15_10550 [Blastocatellia bacterium]|nr:hypothetical protein [Blastocatellia bacterium]